MFLYRYLSVLRTALSKAIFAKYSMTSMTFFEEMRKNNRAELRLKEMIKKNRYGLN